MEAQRLEMFRENDQGQIAFFLATTPPISLLINYDLLAIQAYRFTSQSMRELECSQESLNNGLYNLPAVSMWHQSIHSFLNALIQINCLKRGEDFERLSHLPMEMKYTHLLGQLSINLSEKEKTLNEKLMDYSCFELAIKRDFINGSGNQYQRAKFSKRPMQLNQVDVLQCMLIVVEVFQSFRFTIAGLDLMPNISLQVSETLVFDRLDLLLRSVIVPAVKDILAKQNLITELNLEIDMKSYPVSEFFNERDIVIIAKVIEDVQYKRAGGLSETDIMGYFFNQFARKFEGNEQRFQRHYLAPGFNPLDKRKT